MNRFLLAVLVLISLGPGRVLLGAAPEGQGGPMDNQRLARLIERIEGEVEGRPGFWLVRTAGTQVYVLSDEAADRMRIMIQVTAAEGLTKDHLFRVMQANFGSSIDARYAIAKGMLWSAYLHPLSSLTEEEFFSGLGQTLNLAATYGSTYSAGEITFGDGKGQERQ